MPEQAYLLCIVMGLSWKSFGLMWQVTASRSLAVPVRATVGSALFITALGQALVVADLKTSLLMVLATATVALIAGRLTSSSIALGLAALVFAYTLHGATS